MENIIESLRSLCGDVIALDSEESLEGSAGLRFLNSYMLGAISVLKEVPLSKDAIREAIATTLRNPEINLAAYDAGTTDVLKLSR